MIADTAIDLSKLPGVGDAEVTEEERQAAIQLGHQMFVDPVRRGIVPITIQSTEPSIPASVGCCRNLFFSMPKDQKPYRATSPAAQERLDALAEKDSQGTLEGKHEMIIACAASLFKTEGADDVLADAPLDENESIVLFLNGGGYILNDIPAQKWMYLRLSRETKRRIFGKL
ncbi:hypothetical protein GGI12_004706 [Dipsacomyces acuminosporus]|nr:hypothetical protein GGI12_004706 [Dipsacomyces acuminosporus]